jgi:hypothetical protein
MSLDVPTANQPKADLCKIQVQYTRAFGSMYCTSFDMV